MCTPGRTLDHINRGTLAAEDISSVVLDEGDHMLDMGFRDELEGILDELPARDRTWLFSATMPREVRELSKKYLEDPVYISLVEDGEQHEDIVHKAYLVPMRKKIEGLVNILLWERPPWLIFCHMGLRPCRGPEAFRRRVQCGRTPRRNDPEGAQYCSWLI